MLQCPKCGSKVVKGGCVNHRGSKEGTQRYRCQSPNCTVKHGWNGTQPIGLAEEKRKGIDKRAVRALHSRLRRAKRFVVTSAQNATPVHEGFFRSLLSYCKTNGAELIVIPYRYKNPTSIFTEDQKQDNWWTPEVVPYLYDRRRDLDSHMMILGDIMTQPTAERPLSGYETISGKKSAIIGHPKLELRVIPTPQARLPKILTTTGACTVRNYVHAKAGAKGKFHHTFGAAVVELAHGLFHLRQINALEDGSFMDLDTEYRGDELERGVPIEALNMGDTHEELVSRYVVKATFGAGGIVPTLSPKILFWHDLHDFYARNHHHRADPFTAIAKQRAGMGNVEAALRKTFAFLDTHTPPDTLSVIVNSNHPNAFARWIKECDWKSDPLNAEFYLNTALAMTRATKMTDVGAHTIDPFVHWGKLWLEKRAEHYRFLEADESFVVKGIECTYHGHVGANGSRGSITSFGKIGVKTIIGHSHTPGIRDGCYQNGTNTPLKLEYTSGPSSWLNTDTIIYRNGKRTLINIIVDAHGVPRWRA
jgi:hypothetical protein